MHQCLFFWCVNSFWPKSRAVLSMRISDCPAVWQLHLHWRRWNLRILLSHPHMRKPWAAPTPQVLYSHPLLSLSLNKDSTQFNHMDPPQPAKSVRTLPMYDFCCLPHFVVLQSVFLLTLATYTDWTLSSGIFKVTCNQRNSLNECIETMVMDNRH